ELLLLGAVGADGGQKCPGSHVFGAEERLPGRRARHDDVAPAGGRPRRARRRYGVPSFEDISPANSAARSGSTSKAWTASRSRTRESASSWIRPWLPQPQIVTTRASARARYFAATAVAAPVRRLVISIESRSASGY